MSVLRTSAPHTAVKGVAAVGDCVVPVIALEEQGWRGACPSGHRRGVPCGTSQSDTCPSVPTAHRF